MHLPRWLHRHVETVTTARRGLTIADIRMETVAKWSGRAALAVGAFAFAISYMQIKWVAEETGVQPQWLAWFFPMLIDLPSLAASALTVALHHHRFRIRLYAWLVLLFFSVVSWVFNGVHALATLAEGKNRFVTLIADLAGTDPQNPWLIALVLGVAGIPPIGIVLGVHLWAYALRHSPAADQRADGKATKTAPKQQKAEQSGSGTTDRSGQQQTAPGTKPAPAPEKTAPKVEETKINARHARETAPETAPAAETAPATAPEPTAPEPVQETGTKRSGPKRSGGPARTLIDFAWKIPDDQVKDEWKRTGREMVRSIWETDPGAVNAADIGRELGNPVVDGTMRKMVKAAITELEAWPHWTASDGTSKPNDGGVDETPADSDAPAADTTPGTTPDIRRELHAADPPTSDLDDTGQAEAPADDRQAVGVA